MSVQIEIHENDTVNSGVYKVWYIEDDQQKCCLIAEQYVNSLLNMRQKEDFLMGKYKFSINERDFIDVVIEGKERGGMGEIKRTQLVVDNIYNKITAAPTTQTITELQYSSLITKIYDTLMAMPDMGLGEMGEAKDSAALIVDEWMEENNITVQ